MRNAIRPSFLFLKEVNYSQINRQQKEKDGRQKIRETEGSGCLTACRQTRAS